MDDLDEFPDVEEVDIYDDDLANLLSSSDDARGRGRRRGGGTGRGASRERGLDSDEDEYDEDLEGLVPRGGGDDDDDAREEAVPEAAGTDIHNASSGFYIAGKQLPKIPKEVECYTFNISNDPKAPLMMDGYNCKGTEQLQSTLEVLMNEDDEKIKDPPYVERTLRCSCCCPLRRPPRARAATASFFLHPSATARQLTWPLLRYGSFDLYVDNYQFMDGEDECQVRFELPDKNHASEGLCRECVEVEWEARHASVIVTLPESVVKDGRKNLGQPRRMTWRFAFDIHRDIVPEKCRSKVIRKKRRVTLIFVKKVPEIWDSAGAIAVPKNKKTITNWRKY